MNKLLDILKTKLKLIIVLASILILFLLILLIFFSDSKRIARGLKKADASFNEGAYLLAGEQYDKVMKIDALNKDALVGAVKAYSLSQSEDASLAAVSSYQSAIDKFNNLSTDELNENHDLIVSVCRLAEEIFKGQDGRIDALNEAYELSMHDEEVKNSLLNAYVEEGNSKVIESDYLAAIDDFDKALELSTYDDKAIAGVSKAIGPAIDRLCDSHEFEKAKDLALKYQELLADVDMVAVLNEVVDKEELFESQNRLLSKAIEALIPYYEQYVSALKEGNGVIDKENTRAYDFDFSAAMLLDGSDDANRLIRSMSAGKYLYAEGGFTENYTGIGAGLYPFGDFWQNEEGQTLVAYYFYVGEYKNGARSGNGIMFMKTGETAYDVFEGQFSNDAPNGEGALYIYGNEYERATFGNFSDGYANGTMTEVMKNFEYQDDLFIGTYECEKGIPKEVSAKTDEYEIFFEEGEAKLIDVLPSKNAGYELYITSTWLPGTKIGAIGYR